MNPELWQRAKEIYNSVLERQPGQREAFIAEACAGDGHLGFKVLHNESVRYPNGCYPSTVK